MFTLAATSSTSGGLPSSEVSLLVASVTFACRPLAQRGLDQRRVAEVVFDLALDHGVGVGAELGLRVEFVTVDGLHQPDTADLVKVLVRFLGVGRVPADHVVQQFGVHGEEVLDGAPVATVPVGFDQVYDRIFRSALLVWAITVIVPLVSPTRHNTPICQVDIVGTPHG